MDRKNFREKVEELLSGMDKEANPHIAQQLQNEANQLNDQFSYLNQHFVTAYNHLLRVQKMVDNYTNEEVSSS